MSEITINVPFVCRKHIYIGQALKLRVSARFVPSSDEINDPVVSGCGHVSAIIEDGAEIKVVLDIELESSLKDDKNEPQ